MANEAVTVEARIAAEDHMAVLEGLLGEVQKHGIVATPAMTVQLQAPKGGFAIEALSRETQWIDGSHNQQLGPLQSPSFGQWQWRVKPTQRGHGELVLVVAARTADRDGVVADRPLPEQRIPVRVTVNYLHATTSVLKWVAVAAMGGIVVGFGPQALKMIAKVIG